MATAKETSSEPFGMEHILASCQYLLLGEGAVMGQLQEFLEDTDY